MESLEAQTMTTHKVTIKMHFIQKYYTNYIHHTSQIYATVTTFSKSDPESQRETLQNENSTRKFLLFRFYSHTHTYPYSLSFFISPFLSIRSPKHVSLARFKMNWIYKRRKKKLKQNHFFFGTLNVSTWKSSHKI